MTTRQDKPTREVQPGAATRQASVADVDDDDQLIGRLLSRREVLILTGGVGAAAFVAACSAKGAASSGSAPSDPAAIASAAPAGSASAAGSLLASPGASASASA